MGQREEIISREELLKKIRQSMLVQKENPFENIDLNIDVFVRENEALDIMFATKFVENGGKFVYCASIDEMRQQLLLLLENKQLQRVRMLDNQLFEGLQFPKDLIIPPENCSGEETSISRCEYLAARTGSIVISTNVTSDKLAWTYCKIHIVIASVKQLVPDITSAYLKIANKYKQNFPSIISVVNAASCTTDFEQKLIVGAHGAKELYVFLVDEE